MGLLLFTRLGLSSHRLKGVILHHDLRLSAEESGIAPQRIVHYRTRTSQDPSDIPPRGTVLDFAVFAFALVGLRLIIVWVVNNTKESVLIAILVHASWNTFYATSLIRLFPTRAVLGSYSNLTIAACALALVLIAATRRRLGCQNEADILPKAAAVPPG
jgi:membrane protease YdiL (CAAX protease family)